MADQKTNGQLPSADPASEEYFHPPSDWDHDKESDTLILMLPGFRKEQLRVQVSLDRKLRVNGERKISDNKWRRFRNEIPLPESSETTGISAKFEAGMLYIRIPKSLKPQPPKPPQQPSTTTDKKPDHKSEEEDPKPLQQPPTTTDKKPDHKSEEEDPKPLQQPSTSTDKKPDHKSEEEDPKPLQQPSTSTDKKPDHKSEKEKEQKSQDSDQTPQKEKENAEPVTNNNKASSHDEVQEPSGHVSPTRFQEQKPADHSPHQEKTDSAIGAEAATSEAHEDHMHRTLSSRDDEKELGKFSVVTKIKKRSLSTLNKLSGLAEEVKRQQKVANLVVIFVLLLLFGLNIKNLIKSSFGGHKNEEF